MKLQQGFTLIELLIVIGIIGVLAAVVLVGIDPVDKINAANDTKVQRDVQALATAMESYAINNNGSYVPFHDNAAQRYMKASGDLKQVIQAPSGYTFWIDPCSEPGSAGQPECGKPQYGINGVPSDGPVRIASQLKSKKYINASPSTPWWAWCATSGRAGPVVDANSSCP